MNNPTHKDMPKSENPYCLDHISDQSWWADSEMIIELVHDNAKMPTRSTSGAGGYDIYMPESGRYHPSYTQFMYSLGIKAEVPAGHAALIIPRSSAGFNHTVEINNTCGLIDADYRGEWMAKIRTKNGKVFSWNAGDRILQFIIVPVKTPELVQGIVGDTERGQGGIGSTGT